MVLLLNILLSIIYCYLSFWTAYFLFFSIAGHLIAAKKQTTDESIKFMVLLPAYKEDIVIIESARQAALHNYPSEMFDVVIIADQLKPETIVKLKQIPVNVLEVSFEESTKSKSLNKALQVYNSSYQAVVILDADNIMEPGFLSFAASGIKRGNLAIQGHRCAKNTHTPLAQLDAISEEINNHIFRRGHRALGLSSALIGSAMVFEFNLFCNIMQQIEAIGGFDRELELRLIKQGIKIEYLPHAHVLDEKTAQQEVFKKQRTRWLSAQFHYFSKYAFSGLAALFTGKLDYTDKVLQGIQVPRILLPGILFIFLFITLFTPLEPEWIYWLISLSCACAALLISIPSKYYNWQLVKALFILPKTFINMFALLFKLKGANKSFIHTTHTQSHVNKQA